MPFLLAMDFTPIAQASFPENPRLPLDPIQLVVPMKGQQSNVESFDPVSRATDLSKNLPREWCGTFEPFDGNPIVEVKLSLNALKPIGQMVDIRGSMTLGDFSTPIQGNLHAKSDQLNLIPTATPLVDGLKPGGVFLGLQGFSPAGWQSSRLLNISYPKKGMGGRLALTSSCDKEIPIKPVF